MKTESCIKSGQHGVSRREFLWMTSLSAAGFVVGCATNPVTGKKQFMLVGEDQEIAIDRQHSPHQISSDYGITQDTRLNNYVNKVGMDIARLTHRPQMPYSFKCVNATYVNAYAFPGGTIAATRGILLELDNEAELAALMGHELGHVNARHTAEQMSKGTVAQTLATGLAIAVGMKYQEYAGLAAQVGMLGAGMMLAKYSRDNERQADDLGNQYMVKAGYNPKGFVGLMDMLKGLSKHKPNKVEMLFSTHPMSDERYNTAIENQSRYSGAKKNPIHRERYMDNTSRLRAQKNAIKAMQNGEAAMARKKLPEAERQFKNALKKAPNDYAGLLLMSKCKLAQEQFGEASRYSDAAKRVASNEAQAYHLSGFAKIKTRKFDAALADFTKSDNLLKGNPNIVFFKGYCNEGMGRKKQAAENYHAFLQAVNQGENAKHAYNRLVEWGYIKQQ